MDDTETRAILSLRVLAWRWCVHIVATVWVSYVVLELGLTGIVLDFGWGDYRAWVIVNLRHRYMEVRCGQSAIWRRWVVRWPSR